MKLSLKISLNLKIFGIRKNNFFTVGGLLLSCCWYIISFFKA